MAPFSTVGASSKPGALQAALGAELTAHHKKFVAKNSVTKVRIELFLFPMASKDELLQQLQKRLQAAQDL